MLGSNGNINSPHMGHKFRSVNRSDITLRNVYEIRYEMCCTIDPPCTTAEAEYSSQGVEL